MQEGKTSASCPGNEQKAHAARELGANEAILYRGLSVDDYVKKCTDGRGYDVVFDTVGGDNLDASFQAARYGGTIVNIAARSTHDLTPMHSRGLTLHVVFLVGQVANPLNRHSIKPRLDKLSELAENGDLQPLIDQQQFEIEDVADAAVDDVRQPLRGHKQRVVSLLDDLQIA